MNYFVQITVGGGEENRETLETNNTKNKLYNWNKYMSLPFPLGQSMKALVDVAFDGTLGGYRF